MGALDEGHFNGVLENGVKLGCFELDLEDELETEAIEEAVKVLLQGLGEDVDREGLRKTPLRVAKALREGTRGYRQNVKDIVEGALFPEAGLDGGLGHAGGAGGLVVVRDLDLFSYCESCLLPFQVQCHVGYVPSGQQVVGLSKLSRVADVFSKRLQNPQRLADEVCSALQTGIMPAGVAIVLQCWHICYPEVGCNSLNLSHHPSKAHMQGWVKLSVSSGSGVFENHNADIWSDFLALLKFRGVKIEKNHPQTSQFWCPSRSLDSILCNGHISTKNPSSDEPAMVTAIARILQSLGEDPSRKELVGTPHRFTNWLMNFKTSNLEMKLNSFTSDKMGFLRLNLEKNMVGMGINQNPEEMQSEMNLPFWSQCEHHLLPFHGVVHVGYFHPKGDEPINRSCLQKLVHFYGCKLQVQERLTRQIAETVSSAFNGDVMVVVEANHVCMISRGIEKVGSSTATIAVLGRFSNDPAARAMFLQTVSNTTASGG